ncbi:hypothetical protein L1D31_03190 [Vibrio sp. Isolate23]|uniref:hypothetical protein n=1 Tax=Vibrio sp. Isolate23 TaxID=2908533 RepID=UPI001EFD9DFD|nr:hypothetical protein [Vibrio sp. Isolate23]MCG9681563.1 hypothetical protein [Vibrio sp. Isolate23]
MGKYRRRRVIWVPRGYRLKSRYRTLSQASQAEAQPQAASVSPTAEAASPPSTSQTSQEALSSSESLVQEADKATSNANTKLAEFDTHFNPYQSYVQDLARCLTSMPKSVFSTHPQEEAVCTEKAGSAEEQVTPAKKPRESAPPESGEEPIKLRPKMESEVTAASASHISPTGVNWSQSSSYQDGAAYTYQFHFKASPSSKNERKVAVDTQKESSSQVDENKDKVICNPANSKGKEQPRQPHLRRLTGVRSCMRATDHQ